MRLLSRRPTLLLQLSPAFNQQPDPKPSFRDYCRDSDNGDEDGLVFRIITEDRMSGRVDYIRDAGDYQD